MNYKRLFLTIIILAVIGGAGTAFYLYRGSVASQQPQAQPQGTKIEDKKITDNEKPFKIDIVYPQVAGLDGFNKKADDIIAKIITDFKKNSLDNDKAVKENDPETYAKYPREYDLKISYAAGIADENKISTIIDVYSFEGGAHGAHYFIPLNYNVKEGKEITLADVFSGQPDYLKRISDYCSADLKKQIEQRLGSAEGSWIGEGAGQNADNFSVFMINKDGTITFYFAQYQVAAYAAGDFEVTMPIEK